MTTDSYISAKCLQLVGARFFIFVLVFVSRDFEVDTIRPLWRVDHQSRMGYFSFYVFPQQKGNEVWRLLYR